LSSPFAEATLPWSWYSDSVDVSPDAYRLELHERSSSEFGTTKDAGAVEGQFHWFWPVTKVYVLPGPPNLAAGPVWPLGPERCAGRLDYFFPEDVSDAEVAELLALDDQFGLEDRGLVESVQAGVSSGLLEAGRLLPESERLVAHFQGLVWEALS
jgi:choline monooxygenase